MAGGHQQPRWNARLRAGDREVREERRMIRVRHAGHDLRFEIAHQRVVRPPLRAWSGWKLRCDLARLDVRKYGIVVDAVEVVGDPIDQLVAGLTKFLTRRVELRHSASLSLPRRISQAPGKPRR